MKLFRKKECKHQNTELTATNVLRINMCEYQRLYYSVCKDCNKTEYVWFDVREVAAEKELESGESVLLRRRWGDEKTE